MHEQKLSQQLIGASGRTGSFNIGSSFSSLGVMLKVFPLFYICIYKQFYIYVCMYIRTYTYRQLTEASKITGPGSHGGF